jgi:hypothetical protein
MHTDAEQGEAPSVVLGISTSYTAPRQTNNSGCPLIPFQAITAANDEGVWIGTANSIRLFAMEGDQAPGMAAGVVFSRIQNGGSIMIPFTRLTLAETNQIAFVTGLSGPGVNDSNKIALFASDLNGNLGLVARSGDFLDIGDGQVRQVTQLWPESFNSANQLGFIAFFTDGTNGAFIATVPEPSILALATIAIIASRRRTRRS